LALWPIGIEPPIQGQLQIDALIRLEGMGNGLSAVGGTHVSVEKLSDFSFSFSTI